MLKELGKLVTGIPFVIAAKVSETLMTVMKIVLFAGVALSGIVIAFLVINGVGIQSDYWVNQFTVIGYAVGIYGAAYAANLASNVVLSHLSNGNWKAN